MMGFVSIVFYCISCIVMSSYSLSAFEMRGFFAIHNYQDEMPLFQLYYRGHYSTSNAEGFYVIRSEQQIPSTMEIIFTTQLAYKQHKNNTLQGCYIKNETDYKHYKFLKNPNSDTMYQWEVCASKDNYEIDNNALIIFIDPIFIQAIEEWKVVKLQPGVIKLPRIKLHKKVDNKDLFKQSRAWLLSESLDRKAFVSQSAQISHVQKPGTSLIRIN